MVRRKVYPSTQPEMRTVYLLKCGQALEDIKPSKRIRALVAPKSTFQRFVDYTTEEDRIAAQQEKEIAKITELEKASYEKTKTWSDTIENIKARRKEELLSKRQKASDDRQKFMKKVEAEKKAEHVEIVQQARELLMQRRPLCRRFNRALLVSECLRERDAQVAFQKTISEMKKKQDREYVNSIKAKAAYEEEKKQEEMKEQEKVKDYRMALKKQIEEKECSNKLRATKEIEAGKREQRIISKHLQMMKEKEMQDILNKKRKLQQCFKETIEDKKRFELKQKRNEEFEDRAIEIYRKAKDRIQNVQKSIELKEREERMHRTQAINNFLDQYDAMKRIDDIKNDEILKKAIKEKEMIEAEKEKAQKEREKMMRDLMEEYKLQETAARTKREQEKKEWKAWEMMQRFKRDEYNAQVDSKARKQQWQRKQEYRDELKKDIEERQIEKRREIALETEAADAKAITEKANQRILLYGEQILEESKGVRPLYPIIKAMEECKKEMALIPMKKMEKPVRVVQAKKEHAVRRVCTKPVPADRVLYLQ